MMLSEMNSGTVTVNSAGVTSNGAAVMGSSYQYGPKGNVEAMSEGVGSIQFPSSMQVDFNIGSTKPLGEVSLARNVILTCLHDNTIAATHIHMAPGSELVGCHVYGHIDTVDMFQDAATASFETSAYQE